MDSIFINELRIPTRIGITEEERSKEQMISISVELFTDTSKAGASDDIVDTIDYAAVASAVQDLGKTGRKTLEKFAEDAAAMILKRFQPASVKVTVEKYVLQDARSVAVTIVRNGI